MKALAIALFLAISIIVAGCLSGGESGPSKSALSPITNPAPAGINVEVFKSPTCGCCNLYVEYLEDRGFLVEVTETQNMEPIKKKYNIPQDMQSCHTMVIGDYFVEGHVPIEAINRLLAENPQIDGIALPAMPSGSPGMPGIKHGSFTIYALSDGVPSVFTKL